MKKFLSSFPKRDAVFIGIILVALLVMIFFDTSVEIHVDYDEDILYVTSPRMNMDIPHADVDSVELRDIPPLGVCVDGYQHEVYCTGVWKNDLWGEYDLCVLPELKDCVVITLNSGRKMVFTCTTDEKTAELYASYCAYTGK